MKNMTKTIFALAAVSMSCAFADQMQQSNAPKAPMPAMDPNPSARWGVKDGANLFMTAEALAFKFSQDAAPYAFQTLSTTPANVTTYAAWGDYQWGFRVAGGYNICHDKWDIVATYTRFSNTMTHTVNDNATSALTSIPENSSTGVLSMTNSWKINYNLLDVEQGRQFFVSKYLRLRPKFGLRNLWLWNKQQVTTNIAGILDGNLNARASFWGMGVLAGLDTVWTLGKDFSIYGNIAASGLFGSVNPKTDYQASSSTTTLTYRTHSRAQTKANLDLAIGVRWDKNFSDDRFHISFNAGFEQHIYFNMAQNFFTAASYQNDSGASGRDLALSGFAFGGRFDY